MAKTLNEHLLNDSHNFISLAGVEFAIQRHLQVIFQELSKLSLFHFASAHDNFQNHETMKFSRVLIEIKFFFFKISIKFFYSIEVSIIKLIENYILFLENGYVLKKILPIIFSRIENYFSIV